MILLYTIHAMSQESKREHKKEKTKTTHLQGMHIVITGANSGVGLGIIERSIQQHNENLSIIMACRSSAKSQPIIEKYASTLLMHETLDLQDISSIMNFCSRMKQSGKDIDCFFMNAGMIPIERANPWGAIKTILSNPINFFELGENAVIQKKGDVVGKYGSAFLSNVFGHFIIINQLRKQIKKIVITGSHVGRMKHFDEKDPQCIKGEFPYESSKYLCDLLCRDINEMYGIPCYVTSPGIVATNISSSTLSSGLKSIFVDPFFYLVNYFFLSS